MSAGWKESELEHAAGELAKEYPFVSMVRLVMVLDDAKERVTPKEGRVKLLRLARKSLSR